MVKGRGWHRESYRHSLASRGIKTKQRTKTPLPRTLDSDRDGVPDYKDCDPFDPSKQDTRLNRKQLEIIKSKPVYVTDTSFKQADRYMAMYQKGTLYPIEAKFYRFPTKASKEEAPEAHYKLMAMLRKYPQTIGAIERSDVDIMVFTSEAKAKGKKNYKYGLTDPRGIFRYTDNGKKGIIIREPSIITDKTSKQVHDMVYSPYALLQLGAETYQEYAKTMTDWTPAHDEPKNIQEKKLREGTAATAIHEFRHGEQASDKTFDQYYRMKQIERRFPYEKQLTERDARSHTLGKLESFTTEGKPYWNVDVGLKTPEDRLAGKNKRLEV